MLKPAREEESAGIQPDVVTLYEQALARRGFTSDPAQWGAVERLQRLYEEWTAYKARRNTALRRLIVKPPLPKGVYLWGAVGRGKSFLMDAFFLCVPLVRKRRVHFHHFMREIHRELEELKGTEDPIAAAAARAARRWRLVCFDEFHVSDIADAMILGRFLEQAMERGVEFVMTSNYLPDRLYADGLQRERFLPAIELLKSRLDVLEVDNGTDYRRLKMERLKVYHVGADGELELERIFSELKDVEEEDHPLDVEGRVIPFRRRAGGLVWFEFAALCAGPRSYADYVDLAKRFHTVILSGVPRLSAKSADAARRFTWLVDVFYDDRVKLAVSAEAPPDELFVEGRNSAEFQRAASRLHEMQTAEYLQSERRRSGG
ncbi:MAG: cell division protein ZapE [Betaproteobacteria bacterium RIFCSPHIGHO2_12_FULL_69_13]|nr:MAG: cell division protein ZapE [Betaproteobacteria bacterium RIFCSPHIGHO2_12_FULL_69_13]OGA67042.1 MAG: cell division protein ZapE [Betaproteobacteria bacterium RIFCSPLOWO2_12_FULL_68_20]